MGGGEDNRGKFKWYYKSNIGQRITGVGMEFIESDY